MARLLKPVLVAYSDAEGSGGLGWLVRWPGLIVWGMCTPSGNLIKALIPRTTQIHALELLAVLTLLASNSTLTDCRLVLFVDNQSALGVLRKGGSRSPDLTLIAYHIHRKA